MLRLSENQPLSVTRGSLIFQHPSAPTLLIKVLQPHGTAHLSTLQKYRPARIRFDDMVGWARELDWYVTTLARTRTMPDFLPAFHGFCDTDLGVGYMVEKITNKDNSLAMTFDVACRTVQNAARLTELVNRFFDQLHRYDIVAGDLHARNVVVAGDLDRLVLVDSLGESTLVKLRTYSKFFRRRSIEKRRARFLALVQAG